jgi:hypothetical protein
MSSGNHTFFEGSDPEDTLRSHTDEPSDTLRGSKCCNENFIDESDVCSKCKEHSE